MTGQGPTRTRYYGYPTTEPARPERGGVLLFWFLGFLAGAALATLLWVTYFRIDLRPW